MGEKMLKHIIKKSGSSFMVSIVLFLILILCSANIQAHSPSSMKIIYDKEEKTIDVEITHSVSNPNTHYVNKIEVRINDELYETFDYTSQSGSSFSYTLDSIEASEGDEIEVKAICNQGGQITRQLTVGEANGESSDNESTPGFEILVFVVSLAMVIILIRKRSKP
jgi:hypothetical protein